MSRCLRSPVDAGSIPYSAVTQPLPRPCIHFGTRSSTDAVQITRVPPCSMRAEPLAVLTKPGVITTGRSSSGDVRPSALIASILSGNGASDRRVGGSLDLHVPDAGDRQLEEADAEAPELLRISGREEVVGAGDVLGA